MSSEVKRYAFRLSQLSEVMGGRLEVVEYSGDGLPYVLATDYDALHAEAEALRAALLGIASVNPAERQEQKGPDWKRRSEQGWQAAVMYRAENQELKARLEAALLDGDSLAQQLQESEELLWLAHKCFGDQKAIRSGERGASDRQQAQNRIFKWLDARRAERVATLAHLKINEGE